MGKTSLTPAYIGRELHKILRSCPGPQNGRILAVWVKTVSVLDLLSSISAQRLPHCFSHYINYSFVTHKPLKIILGCCARSVAYALYRVCTAAGLRNEDIALLYRK